MGITVTELLKEPFSNRKQESKYKIISEGKPRPLLNMSIVTIKENGDMRTEVFDPAMYDKVSWLTCSESEKCFYCWPCLLFLENGELWKVSDLAFLTDSMSEHENDVEHIQAALSFKKFCLKYLESNVYDDQWNTLVRENRNREVLKLLIDAVCTIVAASQSFSRNDACPNVIKPDVCVKTIHLIKHYGKPFCKYFENAIELIEMSPTLLDDLVDAMTIVIKHAIMKESRNSTYTALIFSDHSTNLKKSRISVVLRYIKKGKVCERFLGFISMLTSKSTDVICNIIKSTIEALGNVDKFLAYSFDGGILTTSQLTNLIGVLQKKYPRAHFVPCYFQGLHHILQQSLSQNTELTEFFKILTIMKAYFQEACQQRELLQYFIFLNTPRENKSYLKDITLIKFIKLLYEWRQNFIQALEYIIKNNTEYGADYHIKASGFLEFLGQFHTVFLIRILSSLYETILPLDEVLTDISPETKFESDIIEKMLLNLLLQKSYFAVYFNSSMLEMSSNVNFEDQRSAYYSLFTDIIDHLIMEIRLRFNQLNKLAFCSLVDLHSDDDSKREMASAISYWMFSFSRVLGPQFSSELFKSEMQIQYANGMFKSKNAHDMLNCFEDPDLKNVFNCTYRLLEFTLTMPFKPPAQNGCTIKFKKIDQFSFPTACIKTHGDACVLHVESNILLDLQTDVFFYYDVTQKLYEANKNLWNILDGSIAK